MTSVKIKIFSLLAALSAAIIVLAECFFMFRFPIKMREEVAAESAANGVDKSLIYAVIACESGFRSDIKSRRGAVGLMQLMPSTAEWCAKMRGKDFSPEMLCDANYNLSLGCYYLSYLIKKTGNEKWAVAAFNAGEGNVSVWMKTSGKIEFPETQTYVERVCRAKKIYEYRLKCR